MRSAWLVEPYAFENQLNCCEIREVGDVDDDGAMLTLKYRFISAWCKLQDIFVPHFNCSFSST